MNSRIDWYSLLAPSFWRSISSSVFPSLTDPLFQSGVGVSSASHSLLWMTLFHSVFISPFGALFTLCVCLCASVWAQNVDTLITSFLSSEAGAGAIAGMCLFDCDFPRETAIGITHTLIIIDTHVHVCAPYNLVCLPDQQDRWTGDVRFSF